MSTVTQLVRMAEHAYDQLSDPIRDTMNSPAYQNGSPLKKLKLIMLTDDGETFNSQNQLFCDMVEFLPEGEYLTTAMEMYDRAEQYAESSDR